MKYILYLFILLLLNCASPKEEVPVSFSIIPQPDSVVTHGGSFELDEQIEIAASSEDAQKVAQFLQEFLTVNEFNSSLLAEADSEGDIFLEISPESNIPKEGYQMVIGDSGVKILASSGAGLFYGIQSFMQIVQTAGNTLPLAEIIDQPRFSYRGMHLDVGRHMFPVDFIKKYIDMMAHFKYNTFHWHLTEDQGWRIEIKQYPKLQEVAAYRNETVVGHASTSTRDSAKYDGKRYGGYYTQEEAKEVVAYATERFITVIPEIELPGHSKAALTAYPDLGCTNGPYETAKTWGVFEDIYCAGKEETFEFLENVFDEVLPLFPSNYVHIGGDEAPKTQWEKCPHCQKRMSEEGLADEHELQSYFVQRMEKYLNNKGKTIIGWDEILEGGLAPNAVVMSWRGEEGGIEAAKQNHDVIMTPVDWCYLDYYQADPKTEPLAIGGMTTVEEVYSYEPIPSQLSTEEAKHILGAQCNLWTEYITTSDYAEYMVYPRAIAMSEVLWSPKGTKNYEGFIDRINDIQPLLDEWDVNYAKHIFKEEE